MECFEIAGYARIFVDDELDRTDLELIIRRIFMYKEHSELCLKSDIDVLISTKNLEDIVKFHQGIENLNCRIVQTARNQKDKLFDVHVISRRPVTDRKERLFPSFFTPKMLFLFCNSYLHLGAEVEMCGKRYNLHLSEKYDTLFIFSDTL